MNKCRILFGVFITLLVLVFSSGVEMIVKSALNSIPAGVSSQVAILVFSTFLILLLSRKKIIEFNIDKIRIKQIIFPIALTVLLLIFSQFFSILFRSEDHPITESMSVFQQLVFIGILASLSEELLFRGFLQSFLTPLRSFGIPFLKTKITLPVTISGTLFGLMHFALIGTGASFNFVIQIVIFGILMGMLAGYFQEKHNNFIFAFIVHMTANLTSLLLSTI